MTPSATSPPVCSRPAWLYRLGASLLCLTLLVPALVLSPGTVRAGTPPTGFSDTLVTPGLMTPMSLAFLPDGSGRMVIVEQAGRIRSWDGVSLSLLHTMTEVVSGGERGLLGVEVDPDWPSRPYLYVYYTANVGFVQVARFELLDPGGVLTLNPTSKLVLIDNMPDNAGNHNGGTLRFGPDKTLYMSVGDDATSCNAQDLNVLAGKILRIRVDDSIDPSNRSTLAPADNPFVSNPSDNAKLVWAYGLRNPFRFDIHATDNRVFIGDVGQNSWEEVSLANASGLNFGWPYWEGNVRYQMTLCPGQPALPPSRLPIYVYPNPGGASVIGAAVYRGVSFPNDGSFPPAYEDNFFFMDFYAGFLRVLRQSGTGAWGLVSGVSANDWGTSYAFVADMIAGPDGTLYFVTGGGQLRRVTYVGLAPAQATNLGATLQNGFADVAVTWTLPSPETNVDHYEVLRASVYDPDRGGYAVVSPNLSPGTSSWVDVGAGAVAGPFFYFVRSVASGGETTPTQGQVAKFAWAVAAAPVLVSTPVTTPSLLVPDTFTGTSSWSIARAFDASDFADGWKQFDPLFGGSDLASVDVTRGVWLNATAGDLRIAGRIPCATTTPLRAGWNLVGFPSMTTHTVSTATGGLAGPIVVEGYAAGGPYHLIRLGASDLMGPTNGYWISSPAAQAWTITNDARPTCR